MSRQDFWSRRKARVEAEEAAADEAVQVRAVAKAEAEKTDAELLAELKLPDPDTLVAGDDFSAFMAKAVPQRLRTRALRNLWRTNPTLANLDGLIDYGQDFTDSAMAVTNIQTGYQVGKGMMYHVQKVAELAARENAPEITPDDEPIAEDAPEIVAQADVPAEPVPADDVVDESPPRRRMRFDFDADATA